MSQPMYEADCDLVIEMEEAGVGVEEILQYARGVLSREEIRALVRGLEAILDAEPAPERSQAVEVQAG